jgi:hypothetical protein
MDERRTGDQMCGGCGQIIRGISYTFPNSPGPRCGACARPILTALHLEGQPEPVPSQQVCTKCGQLIDGITFYKLGGGEPYCAICGNSLMTMVLQSQMAIPGKKTSPPVKIAQKCPGCGGSGLVVVDQTTGEVSQVTVEKPRMNATRAVCKEP